MKKVEIEVRGEISIITRCDIHKGESPFNIRNFIVEGRKKGETT